MLTPPGNGHTGYKSHEVRVGNLLLGHGHPVRIQSMTNTPTNDILSTTRQVAALRKAGCELVRISARNVTEARLLKEIRKELDSAKVHIPLIADIHFLPEAALEAARHADKVRINPGNYTGKTSGMTPDQVKEIISERLRPLLDMCRKEGKAIRIGVNQGSLAGHILEQYGNTADGLVASALEFIRICHEESFSDLVISIKSSRPATHISANRLLIARMIEEGFSYPLHLGVTEAGFGQEGIMRSVCGLTPLLSTGIGDTIRVSLTGNPLAEIPVALALKDLFPRTGKRKQRSNTAGLSERWGAPFDKPVIIGESDDQAVHLYESEDLLIEKASGRKWKRSGKPGRNPVYHASGTFSPGMIIIADGFDDAIIENPDPESGLLKVFRFRVPSLSDTGEVIRAAAGSAIQVFNNGFHGLWPDNDGKEFAISFLQAAGLRRSGTEIIACPTCARTNFNIEELAQRLKVVLSDFKDLKVAVMGCVVNGPGEMEDADYGCIGAGKNKVQIYRKGDIIERNVPQEEVPLRLISVIRKDLDATNR